MGVRAMLPLALVVVLGALSCEGRSDAPAGEPVRPIDRSVVDLSDPVSAGRADPSSGEVGLAAILPSTFEGIDRSLFRWDRPEEKEIDKTSPLVALETRVLKTAPGFYARLPGEADGPVRRVARDALESLLEEERDAGRLRQLSSPKLTSYSGQLSHTLVVTQAAYIQDLTLAPKEDGTEGLELTPKIGVLDTGTVVLARPAVAGGGIEIRNLGVEVVEQLASRECTGTVEHGDESWDIVWEEPVILVAKPDPDLPETLRLEEDETLVVPLRYEVRQACANVRALVAKDSLVETLRKSAGPVTRECVVLVDVRREPRQE